MTLTISPTQRLILITAGLPIILFSVWVGWAFVVWSAARSRALDEFRHSRGNMLLALDSSEFALRGVQSGADEQQVDRCMEGSSFRTGLTRSLQGAHFAKYYSFTYGVFELPVVGFKSDIIREEFIVYFDEKLRVICVERFLTVKGGLLTLPGEGHANWTLRSATSDSDTEIGAGR